MNIRHHLLSAVLVSSLVLTTSLPALAADDAGAPAISQDQQQAVIAKVRAMFGGLADLPNSVADYQADMNIWELSFAKGDPLQVRDDVLSKPVDFLNVVVDAKTYELQFLFQTRTDWGPKKHAPNNADTKKAADEFLKQVAPDLFAKVQFVDISRIGDPTAVARYAEVINGAPFPDSEIAVNIDEYGHVLFFTNHLQHNLPPLPDKTKAVPMSQAQETFNRAFVVDKFYISHVPQADMQLGETTYKQEGVLAYAPFFYPTVDAITGTLSEPYVEPPKAYTLNGDGWQTEADSQEVARNIAARLLGLDSAKMVLNGSTPPDVKNGQNWSLSWTSPGSYGVFDAGNYQMLSVGRDAELTSDAKPSFSLEDGKQKALDVLKHVLPTGEQTVFLSSTIDNSKTPTDIGEETGNPPSDLTYTYLFNPSHQGVRIADLTYAVTLNSVTGAVNNVTMPPRSDYTLPDNKNTLPLGVVTANFLHDHPLRLTYSGQYGPNGLQGVNLVYSMSSLTSQFAYLDAFTGKTVTYDGTDN